METEAKRKPGRPAGSQNKVTKALKDMILGALDEAGGQAYLVEQAMSNPNAFMTLIGKVLPMQIGGDPSNPLHLVSEIRETLIDSRPSDTR